MNDCKGKELAVGQEVVFSVGTKLVTGTVARVRQATRYDRVMNAVKVTLNPPEEITSRHWEPVPNVGQDAPWHERNQLVITVTGHRHFRELWEEQRILILKDAK